MFGSRMTILFVLAACIMGISISSCARMEKRAPRYNEKACPFCTQKAGECMYCEGSAKCTYCKGSGKRTTVSPELPEEGIKGGQYTETCSFCKGTGKCRYCEGSAKCWACDGTAHAGDWNFYDRYQKIIAATKDSVALALTPPAPAAPAAVDSAAQKK